MLLLAAWLIGQRIYAIRSDRGTRTAAADEKAAWATRLEPALATIHTWKTRPEQKCAVAATDAPWFAYAATGPDGSVIEATSRMPAGQFSGAELVVGLREHEGTATVVVMKLATGAPLCWTEESGAAPLHERAAMGVSRISSVSVVD